MSVAIVWWGELPQDIGDEIQDAVIQLHFDLKDYDDEKSLELGRDGYELPDDMVRRIAEIKRGPRSQWEEPSPETPAPARLRQPKPGKPSSYGFAASPRLSWPPPVPADIRRELRSGNLFVATADGSLAFRRLHRRLHALTEVDEDGWHYPLTIHSESLPPLIRTELQRFFWHVGGLEGPLADRVSIPKDWLKAIGKIGFNAPPAWVWPPGHAEFVQPRAPLAKGGLAQLELSRAGAQPPAPKAQAKARGKSPAAAATGKAKVTKSRAKGAAAIDVQHPVVGVLYPGH